MNYPSELEQMLQEREAERYKKRKCAAVEKGGRCYYTQEECEKLEKVKEKVKFTYSQDSQ